MENLIDNNPNKQKPIPEQAAVHPSTLTDWSGRQSEQSLLRWQKKSLVFRGKCELNVFPTTCRCSYCSPARVTACAWHHRGYTGVFCANAGCYCIRAPAAMKCLPGLCFLPNMFLPGRIPGRKLKIKCKKILPTNTDTVVQCCHEENVTELKTPHQQRRDYTVL